MGFIFAPFFSYAQVGPPVTTGFSITAEVPSPQPPQPPPPWPPWPPFPYATVVFKGKAYPSAFITILKDGSVAASFTAQNNGYFSKTLSGLDGGIYTFGIWAEDNEGRKSVTLSFTVDIIGGATTTISGIYLPPTIEIDKIKLKKGELLNYSGQSYPSSAITLFVFSDYDTKQVITGNEGKWNYSLETSFLDLGSHTTKSKSQTDDGEQSTFSETLSFEISSGCSGADLNQDGKVNLIDFSILLYWWERWEQCADLNSDGVVNLIDFSIMMYYWTG